jgi:endonuclease/exonuclease/phosphatase family metal-dependent hydrolase/2'-5' RNA ligase
VAFPTEQQTYHRIRWDPRFDVKRCHIVINLRPSGTQRMPFVAFDPELVPWHRITEFWLDDELAWSRPQRIDRLDELANRGRGIEPQALAGVTLEIEPCEPTARDALRVVTWNLLFDRHDADLLDSERRWQAAFDELAALDADVIALVEVTPRMWRLLRAQPWTQRYAASDPLDAPALAPYGQVLLSRLPIREAVRAPIVRDRSVLLARLAGPHDLGVAVVHLTSNRSDDAAVARDAQLAAVLGHIAATPRDAWLVLGDFNAEPAEHAALAAAARAVDLWERMRPDDPGLTFDVDRNPLAGLVTTTNRSARLDRILAIEHRAAVTVRSATLLGIAVGSNGLPPSDHYGVAVELALAPVQIAAGVSHAPPSHHTALAIVPPREVWGAMQRIRCVHDRGFERWPPHVTLFHPFLDETWLDRATRIVEDVASELAPFELILDRSGPLEPGSRTFTLLPDRRSARSLEQLQAALAARFPTLEDPIATFRPHLTLARDTPPPAIDPIHWRAETLAILVLRDGRFEITTEIALGHRATVHCEPEPEVPHPARTLVAEAAHELGLAIELVPFGSTVYAPAHARDLDLHVRTTDPARASAALAERLGLVAIGARLRGTLAGIRVDLDLGADDSGPRDAAKLLGHLRAHGRHDAFLATWPHVLRFVEARAIGANGLGWFGSFGWATLLAEALCHDAASCELGPGQLFAPWLRWLAAIDVAAQLGPIGRGLTAGTSRLLRDELQHAARRVGDAADDLDAVARAATPVPIAGALAISGVDDTSRGPYEGRFRGLLLALEAALGLVRPWGWFAREGERWTHFVRVPDGFTAQAIALVENWLANEDLAATVSVAT